jgi:hypothetical protein
MSSTPHVDVTPPHIDAGGGVHIDTATPPHGDRAIHIDTPAGPHVDTGGAHIDQKTQFFHADTSMPHVDTSLPPHGDTSPHIDTPSGPHVDAQVPPHVDVKPPHVDTPAKSAKGG